MDASPRVPRRAFRLAVVAAAAGLLLAFVPVPSPSFLPAAVTELSMLQLDRPVGASELHRQASAADDPVSDARISGVATGVAAFDTLGVVLDDVPEEPVLVRLQDPDGTWGEWNEVEVEVDMGPEPGTVEDREGSALGEAVSEPIWVGEAIGYEVSVGAEDADEVGVLVVREETRRVVAEAVPYAEAALAAPFGINSRASWGARAPRSAASVAPALQLAVVHHTASSNNYTAAQVPGILRSMQAFHMDGNGWSDIAYNFLVDKYGGLWEGRAGGTTRAVVGAHARGFNTGSVGVSVLGNYVNTASTAAAREAVSRVIGYRLQVDGVDPRGRVNVTSLGSTTIPAGQTVNLPTVVGHRDVGATACPGSIQSTLGSIRTRAGDWYAWMDALSSPSGAVGTVRVDGNRVDVFGWARDGDQPEIPTMVHVVFDGRRVEALANRHRPDVGRLYPGHGDHRGWQAGFSDVPEGTHRLCATAINHGFGHNKLLGCQDVVVK